MRLILFEKKDFACFFFVKCLSYNCKKKMIKKTCIYIEKTILKSIAKESIIQINATDCENI